MGFFLETIGSLLKGEIDIIDAGYIIDYNVNAHKNSHRSNQANNTPKSTSKYVSSGVFPPDFPDIEKIYQDDREKYWAIHSRVSAGFFCASHVFAYHAKKEPLHDEYWDKDKKACANSICHAVGLEDMYPGIGMNLSVKDFGVDSEGLKPILTKDIILAAYKRFPFKISDVLCKTEIMVVEEDQNK